MLPIFPPMLRESAPWLWTAAPCLYLLGIFFLWLTRYTAKLYPRYGKGYYRFCAITRPFGIVLITIGWTGVLTPPEAFFEQARYPFPLHFFPPNLGMTLVALLGSIGAFGVVLWSITHLGARTSFLYRAAEDSLVDDGPYGLVRHPQFLGSILLAFFASLLYNSLYGLLNTGVFTVALFVLAILEEKDLLAQYGETYEAYCRKVPRIFPN